MRRWFRVLRLCVVLVCSLWTSAGGHRERQDFGHFANPESRWFGVDLLSAFSCPHLDLTNDYCMRLRVDCVPGRPGCVLEKNSVFAFPVEERICAKEEARRRKEESLRKDGRMS